MLAFSANYSKGIFAGAASAAVIAILHKVDV
jgi:hypothetical protein